MSTREIEKSEKRKQEQLGEDDPREEMEAESASGEEESSDEPMEDEELEQLETEFEAYPPLPCDREGRTRLINVLFFDCLTIFTECLQRNFFSLSRNQCSAQAALQEGANRTGSADRASDKRTESVHGLEANGR